MRTQLRAGRVEISPLHSVGEGGGRMTPDFYQEHWGVLVPVAEMRIFGSLGVPAMPVWDLLSFKVPVDYPGKISRGPLALMLTLLC